MIEYFDKIFVILDGHVFQWAFLWTLTVLLFMSPCSFFHMRQTLFNGPRKNIRKKLTRSFNLTLKIDNSKFGD